MQHMFRGTPAFDQPIGSLDLSSVAPIQHMFRGNLSLKLLIGTRVGLSSAVSSWRVTSMQWRGRGVSLAGLGVWSRQRFAGTPWSATQMPLRL